MSNAHSEAMLLDFGEIRMLKSHCICDRIQEVCSVLLGRITTSPFAESGIYHTRLRPVSTIYKKFLKFVSPKVLSPWDG